MSHIGLGLAFSHRNRASRVRASIPADAPGTIVLEVIPTLWDGLSERAKVTDVREQLTKELEEAIGQGPTVVNVPIDPQVFEENSVPKRWRKHTQIWQLARRPVDYVLGARRLTGSLAVRSILVRSLVPKFAFFIHTGGVLESSPVGSVRRLSKELRDRYAGMWRAHAAAARARRTPAAQVCSMLEASVAVSQFLEGLGWGAPPNASLDAIDIDAALCAICGLGPEFRLGDTGLRDVIYEIGIDRNRIPSDGWALPTGFVLVNWRAVLGMRVSFVAKTPRADHDA